MQHDIDEPASGSSDQGDKLNHDGLLKLDQFSPALITWAAHRLAANNSIVYRDKFDVSLMEWRVILHLALQQGSSVGTLAKEIGFDKATISRTVDSLHGRALLDEQVSQLDARTASLTLTSKGMNLYREILPVALEQERQLLSDLSAEEADLFVNLLARVIKALRQQPSGKALRGSPTAGTTRRRHQRSGDGHSSKR